MELFGKTCDEKVCPACLACCKGTSELCSYGCKKCRISELENDLHSLVIENEKLKEDLKMLDFYKEQCNKCLSQDYRIMEQDECIEKLELEINDLRSEVKKWQKFYEESEESHLETKELLRSMISEIERCKQVLKEIKVLAEYI